VPSTTSPTGPRLSRPNNLPPPQPTQKKYKSRNPALRSDRPSCTSFTNLPYLQEHPKTDKLASSILKYGDTEVGLPCHLRLYPWPAWGPGSGCARLGGTCRIVIRWVGVGRIGIGGQACGCVCGFGLGEVRAFFFCSTVALGIGCAMLHVGPYYFAFGGVVV
jgi:hypothetical protein